MSSTIRFPLDRTGPRGGQAETSQIITIHTALTQLPRGGVQAYTLIRPWWIAGDNNEAPYECVVLDFRGNIAGTIGNGTTDLIGLYGEIDLVDAPANSTERIRTLLGIVGINIGGTTPQIPVVRQAAAASDFVGFSQVFTNIAAYDRLSIGGVLADINLPDGMTVTVIGRPIRRRDYLG